MNTHTVEPTPDGRFAVLKGKDTILVFCDEFAAITFANALNSQPVRSVEPRGRWTEKEQEEAA
jgi:hypothetical protein